MDNAMTAASYRTHAAYREAPPGAQATVDAVLAALARFTSPEYGVDHRAHNNSLAVSFTWHDGAEYEVTLNMDGELLRLFRLQYTGAWEWSKEEGRHVPAEEWRTVRAFAKDRAGKVLGPAMAGRAAAKSWTEASAR